MVIENSVKSEETKSKMTCFFISPIGEVNSQERIRSDQVIKFIINPIISQFNFEEVVRADHLSEPGLITSQVITRIVESNLVIADLTDNNPNVFYELAIRHAVNLPFIHLIKDGQKIPFDVAPNRTIFYNLNDPDNIERTKNELNNQVDFIIKNPTTITSPVSIALDFRFSGDKNEVILKKISEMYQMIVKIHSNLDGWQSLDDVYDKIDDVERTVNSIESTIESIESSIDSLNNSGQYD